MRKPLCDVSASRELACGEDAVWSVISTADSYEKWYGYPEAETLESVLPAFCVGGRLTFRNRSMSKIITEYKNGGRFILSDNDLSESFFIEQVGEGACRVTLTESAHDKKTADEELLRKRAERILERLGECAQAEQAKPKTADVKPRARDRLRDSWALSVLRGYKHPASESSEGTRFDEYTEQEIKLERRSVLFAAFLAVLMFSALSVTGTFERGDIVPSSGLSLIESSLVNSEAARDISFDMTKKELELELSCAGERLSADLYRYSSLEKAADAAAKDYLYVVYDAYGRVRRYAFIDRMRGYEELHPAIKDFEGILGKDMSVGEIIEAVGQKPSAFTVDKSGAKRVFFGNLDIDADLFDSSLVSELTVDIDYLNDRCSAEYYPPHVGPFLEGGELSARLKRQFAEKSEYLRASLAADRAYMLLGRTERETAIILKDEGERYSEECIRYTVGEETGRPLYYDVVFRNGAAHTVTFINEALSVLTRETLSSDDALLVRPNMTRDHAAELLGIVPSAVRVSADTVTVFYGSLLEGGTTVGMLDGYDSVSALYRLELTMSSDSLRIERINRADAEGE